MNITLPTLALRVVSLFAANNDLRTMLNGVFITTASNAAYIVATNGVALGAIKIPGTFEYANFIVPKGIVDRLNSKSPTITLFFNNIMNGEHIFKPIDAKFPDWRRTIPKELSGKVGQFDPQYLNLFSKAAALVKGGLPRIGHNGESGCARVYIGDKFEFLGLLMPVRSTTPEFKEFI